MANIKWSGLESWKYELTARWYVSAYYGNDIDVDSAGYYSPTTNVTGHGGPTRPFASIDKLLQDSNVLVNSICILDSGYYKYTIPSKTVEIIGDGSVTITNNKQSNQFLYFRNCHVVNTGSSTNSQIVAIDTVFLYCSFNYTGKSFLRCILIECDGNGSQSGAYTSSCLFLRCSNFLVNVLSQSPVSSGNFFMTARASLLQD